MANWFTLQKLKISKKVSLIHLKCSWRVKGSLLINAFFFFFFESSQSSFQNWDPIFPSLKEKMFFFKKCYSYWRSKYKAVLLCKKWLCCPQWNICGVSWRQWQEGSEFSWHFEQGAQIKQLLVLSKKRDATSRQLELFLSHVSAKTMGKG